MIPHTSPAGPHAAQAFEGVRIPRRFAVIGAGVVAGAAALSSFLFTARFGANNGYPWGSCVLLPLTTDGLAAVALYRGATTGAKAAWAWLWIASAASVVGNALGHSGAQSEWLTYVAGGWPALCLAVVAHLLRPERPAPTIPTPAPAAPPAAVTGPLDAAPGSAQASGPAAPTSDAELSRDAGPGTPDVVGAADSPEPAEPTPAAVALTEAALAPMAPSPYGTASRDECLAAAKSLGNAELVRHARDHRIPTTVLGFREAYAVPHSRARDLNRLASGKPPAPSPADQGPAAAGAGVGVRA